MFRILTDPCLGCLLPELLAMSIVKKFSSAISSGQLCTHKLHPETQQELPRRFSKGEAEISDLKLASCLLFIKKCLFGK
jgi:hypothetical protein